MIKAPDRITRLIVNADDLGSGPVMDCGIFRAVRQGIVTSVSLLPNGSSFVEAAREVRLERIPVGVHLNIAEGESLTGEIGGLTACGKFPGKAETRRRLVCGAVDSQALRAELIAQIERLFDAGLNPDHFDTHQHTFLFPAMAKAVLEAAGHFGIRAGRLPMPAEPAAETPGGFLGEEVKFYRSLGPAAAHILRGAGIAVPDGLWGMPYLNRFDEKRLASILRALPAGVWELMVHPGGLDAANPFAGSERQVETAALTSPGIAALIRERQIELTHFGELPCAS